MTATRKKLPEKVPDWSPRLDTFLQNILQEGDKTVSLAKGTPRELAATAREIRLAFMELRTRADSVPNLHDQIEARNGLIETQKREIEAAKNFDPSLLPLGISVKSVSDSARGLGVNYGAEYTLTVARLLRGVDCSKNKTAIRNALAGCKTLEEVILAGKLPEANMTNAEAFLMFDSLMVRAKAESWAGCLCPPCLERRIFSESFVDPRPELLAKIRKEPWPPEEESA